MAIWNIRRIVCRTVVLGAALIQPGCAAWLPPSGTSIHEAAPRPQVARRAGGCRAARGVTIGVGVATAVTVVAAVGFFQRYRAVGASLAGAAVGELGLSTIALIQLGRECP